PDVVAVDADASLRERALEEQGVAGARRAPEHAPVARAVGQRGAAVRAQPDEGVLAGHEDFGRVNRRQRSSPWQWGRGAARCGTGDRTPASGEDTGEARPEQGVISTEETAMSTRYLHLVRMDVAHDHEAIFNDIYDHEHVPALLAVPGVARATRYRQPSPTDPRYIAAYELESPAVLQSAQWKAAAESGRWPKDVRPHTMNRHIATYEWVGSSRDLTYKTPYVFWVMMDIEPHREALFNDLYDNEHVPLLLKLPGSVNVVRYRTEAAGEPRYLAAYEAERTALPMSQPWNDTSDIGRR